jgi:hypothetical protein
MSDSGFRWLVLSAAGAVLAWSPVSSVSNAAEFARIVSGRSADSTAQAAFTVKIVASSTETGKASGIEITPFGQIEDVEDLPILVAPAYDEEPEAKKAGKKPSKPGSRKSDKADKTPAATETGSRKAREEWKKKQAAERQKRKPKSQTSAKSEKTKSGKSADDTRSKEAAEKADKAAVSEKMKALQAKKAADKSKAAKAAAAKSATAVNAGDCPPARTQIDFHRYREIYNSIPFSRAEYDANPAYRHQATMEIIIGQLHPVIVAHPAPPRPQPRMGRSMTIRFLPIIRPGYRSWSRYPWH